MVSYPLLVGILYKKSKLGLRLKLRSCLLPNHSFPQWPLVLLLRSWKKLKLVGGIGIAPSSVNSVVVAPAPGLFLLPLILFG